MTGHGGFHESGTRNVSIRNLWGCFEQQDCAYHIPRRPQGRRKADQKADRWIPS